MLLDPNNLPPGIPPEAVPGLKAIGYFDADPIAVGDTPPDLPLYTFEGEEVRLRSLHATHPAVLVFGSFT